jgi:uncharacterized RDD family membrane protein YckC
VTDDPFGRRGEEETDAFGRPVEERGSLWSGAAEEDVERPAPPRFLPPTEAPPDASAWERPAPPAPPGPSGAPPAPGGRAVAPEDVASYLDRAGAAVIDFFVRLAIALVAVAVAAIVWNGDEDAIAAAALLSLWVITPFYAPIAMTRWDGQTIGHRATSTRIVTKHGRPVTGGKAVVREVLAKHLLLEMIGGFLSFGIAGLLNYLWPLWDSRNEALHDKMCDTIVVKV